MPVRVGREKWGAPADPLLAEAYFSCLALLARRNQQYSRRDG
jgi:hypothetical protein